MSLTPKKRQRLPARLMLRERFFSGHMHERLQRNMRAVVGQTVRIDLWPAFAVIGAHPLTRVLRLSLASRLFRIKQ